LTTDKNPLKIILWYDFAVFRCKKVPETELKHTGLPCGGSCNALMDTKLAINTNRMYIMIVQPEGY